MSRNEARIEVREGPGGKSAFINGTRIRVLVIARLFEILQEELLMDRMLEEMPTLSKEQISEALAYWREHPREMLEEIDEENEAISKIPPAW